MRLFYFFVTALFLSVTFNNCDGSHISNNDLAALSASTQCSSVNPTASPAGGSAVPTYDDNIKPLIFQRVCSQCHGTIAGIPNWLDYNQALAKKDIIKFRVQNKIMPPANATINSLTPEEIAMVVAWVDSGAPKSAGGSVASNCSSIGTDGSTTPIDNSPPPPPPDPLPPEFPTYSRDIKPMLFVPICGSCHGVRPDIPNWQIYSEAEKRADKILRKVSAGEMPPPSSGMILTANQKELVRRWVTQGAQP